MDDLCFPAPAPSGWDTVSAEEAGWSADGLEEVARYCEKTSATQLLILHRGRILLERHWGHGDPAAVADVASVQKSVVSLLLGILEGDGRLSLDDPVSRWLGPDWSRAPSAGEEAILLRHLSSMTSGLYDDFTVEAAPDRIWYYNNNAYHQLRRVIEVITGATTQQVFDRFLGGPLGISGARWVERPQMVDPNGWVLSGFHANARHLARVGLCVLAGGRWDTTQLVDEGLLARFLASSQQLNPSYGHLWWLPTQPRAVLPGGEITDSRKAFGGQLVNKPVIPSAPAGLVAGFGAGDKRLYVSAALGTVVVRLGPPATTVEPGSKSFDEELWRRLMVASPSVQGSPLNRLG